MRFGEGRLSAGCKGLGAKVQPWPNKETKVMFFHVLTRPSLGLGPHTKKKVGYEVSVQKCALGIGAVLMLMVAAFIAHAEQWGQAADLFLDLTKILVGALAGAFVGERKAIREMRHAEEEEE
jgi:hypothetical protein